MKRPATLLLAALAAAATACASSGPGESAAAPPSPSTGAEAALPPSPAAPAQAPTEGLFTEAQAVRGRATFRSVCADCHYSSEFRDSQFQFKWGRRTVADLYENIVENMPDDAPGSLERQQYIDVVSYILQLNGFPAGPSELTAESPSMSGATLNALPGSRQPSHRPDARAPHTP